ncbi:MAG TPA: ABC transporter ATP-binding protein [Candidatus Limnocylindria bacterium]|nr:ABC transporter ATP-binding protein [Candidatus Limnocylindria bacterium]
MLSLAFPDDSRQDPIAEFIAYAGDVDRAIALLEATRRPNAPKPARNLDGAVEVVRLESVTKSYKLGRQRVEALKGVSVSVKAGEFVAITGTSGSGKSTLLQIMGGLDQPTSGQVTVDGQNIGKLRDRKLSEFRNKTVGFVFQFFYLQPFLNTQLNLEVPGMFAGARRGPRKQRAAELAGEVGLADRLRHLPKELSGGQMQRAAIARALLNSPKLLLADEPTGNLDRTNGRAIIDLFEAVREKFNTTIILVTHDPEIANRADREISLQDGRLL